MFLLSTLLLALGGSGTLAFAPSPFLSQRVGATPHFAARAAAAPTDSNYLLKEFEMCDGQVVNPYNVLNVPRTASESDVKRSFYKMSRLYHPDMVNNRDGLPGLCKSTEEARAEWDRVKFSYDILKDKRVRQRYDRHEALASLASDPIATGVAALKGLSELGAICFEVCSFTLGHLAKAAIQVMNDVAAPARPMLALAGAPSLPIDQATLLREQAARKREQAARLREELRRMEWGTSNKKDDPLVDLIEEFTLKVEGFVEQDLGIDLSFVKQKFDFGAAALFLGKGCVDLFEALKA